MRRVALRRCVTVAAFVAVAASLPAWADEDLGARLPDGSKRVGEHRFEPPEGYDGTLKYYRSNYPASQYPRVSIMNQQGVKAIHIANPHPKAGGWEGLNIYEADNGVRIYVVSSSIKDAKTPKRKK